MASENDKAVVKIAIKYWLDGDSLSAAQDKARAQQDRATKGGMAYSKRSIIRHNQMTLSESKKTDNILKRRSIAEIKDNEALGRKSRRKRSAEEVKDLQRRWSKRHSKNKKELKIETDRENNAKSKNSISGGFKNFKGKLGTISAYGAAIAVIGALKQAITFAITKTIEFEKSFTDLAVKSGYTTKEMASVTDSIYKVAASTKFSTMEIVQAATALGKLGFEANSVVEILPNVANVAGATGTSLEQTAQVFGKVMNAYSLAAEQSLYVADLMVDTFNNSALDIEKFNTAFSYVGAAAASTGTSVTELTVAMGILSDKGVTASKIGTGLRNVFTKLGREGDTLRDIIGRVNEENLSFYEIAELVGRRAANQLFILMDSIGDFDTKLAESVNNFGSSWEANAKQMNTFSAKWDIFMNNITNKVAGLEFDPDETFRASLEDSIGLMTKLNALKIFNEDGADIAVFNQMSMNKEFMQQAYEIRESLLKEGSEMTDADLEKRIHEELIKAVEVKLDNEKILKIVNDGITQDWGAGEVYSKAYLELSKKEKKIAQNLAKQKRGLNELSGLSDGDSYLEALDKFGEGKEKSKAAIKLEQWTSSLKSITQFIGMQKKEYVNEFNKAIKEGDNETTVAIINKLKDEGVATGEAMKRLLIVQGSMENMTDKVKEGIRDKSDKTAVEKILEEGRGFKITSNSLLDKNKKDGGKATIDNLFGDDLTRYDKAIEGRKAWESKMCSKAQEGDAAYLRIIKIEKINCPTRKGRKPALDPIEKFDKFTQDDIDYNEAKDLLKKQYSAEDDVIGKSVKNKELLVLEENYRDALNERYEDYLKEQERIRNKYIAKNGERGQVAFDKNVDTTSDNQLKDKSKGVINENTYNTRDLELKAKKYKEAFNLKQEYQRKMSELSLAERELDKDDFKEREAIRIKQNKLTRAHYKNERKEINDYYDEIDELINEVEIMNSNLPVDERIDTSEIQETSGKRDGSLSKSSKRENDAIKEDPAEDFDYMEAGVKAYDEITGLFTQAGEMRLQVLQAQADAELAIIQGRHEAEQGIVDAALQAGIISQEDGFAAKERLEQKKIDKENKVAKKLFDAQKKQDMQTAIFTGVSSTAQAIAKAFANSPNPVQAGIFAAISAAAIAASTAMNIKGIGARKFVPKKYADGGMVHGKSHAQGGIPFTVNNQSGYEMEGGEYIVNKESAKNNLAELDRINGKTRTGKRKFATGGQVAIDNTSGDDFNEAILEALNRPVRAFVSDQDLTKSDSERKALARKTSY